MVMEQNSSNPIVGNMVLYCLLRRWNSDRKESQFLLIKKQDYFTFPATKLRANEDLYHALIRALDEDLKIKSGKYFIEEELPMIPSSGTSPRPKHGDGLPKNWFLYPLVMSYHEDALDAIPLDQINWMTIDEIIDQNKEPNILTIAQMIKKNRSDLCSEPPKTPSMDALACAWSAQNSQEVRIVRQNDIKGILNIGNRAFNLRVADPYLPYHKQGLGFTWSFFTPKDKQDLHVHGLPSVEIYGILEGELLLWYKPMNQRGARSWSFQLLRAGDWAEVGPLQCHFACWLTKDGLGTVIKAAGAGELAGVGRLGISGKTVCQWKDHAGNEQHCSNYGHCLIHPIMEKLMIEYGKPFEDRKYDIIRMLYDQI